MRIKCVSGLSGQVVAYQQQHGFDLDWTYGWAIVRRDGAPYADRPYSVHFLAGEGDGLAADSGHYDLTGDEALALWREKVGA